MITVSGLNHEAQEEIIQLKLTKEKYATFCNARLETFPLHRYRTCSGAVMYEEIIQEAYSGIIFITLRNVLTGNTPDFAWWGNK